MAVTSTTAVTPQHHPDPLALATVSADLDVTLRNAVLKPLSRAASANCTFEGECSFVEFKIRHGTSDARAMVIGDHGEVVMTEGYLIELSSLLESQVSGAANDGIVELLSLAERSHFCSDLVARSASSSKSKLVRVAVERRCKQRLSAQERALLGLIPPEALTGMQASVLRALNSLEAQLRNSLRSHLKFGLGALSGLTIALAALAASQHTGYDIIRETLGPWSSDAALTWVVIWAGAAAVLGASVAASIWWKRSRVRRILRG